jgi:hypothetical protein
MGISYRPKTDDYNVTYKKLGVQLKERTDDFNKAVKIFEEFVNILGERSRRNYKDFIKPKKKKVSDLPEKIKALRVFDCLIIEGKEGQRCHKSYHCNDYNECLTQVNKLTNWYGWKEDINYKWKSKFGSE